MICQLHFRACPSTYALNAFSASAPSASDYRIRQICILVLTRAQKPKVEMCFCAHPEQALHLSTL